MGISGSDVVLHSLARDRGAVKKAVPPEVLSLRG